MAAAPVRPNQREHILDVALRLMSENGSAGTSMRVLARECGLNVAAIYHYFESKDALLAAVIEERRYGARMAEIPTIPPHLDAEGRLRAVFHEVWRGAVDEEPVWRLLLVEGVRGEPAALPVGRSLLEVISTGLDPWLAETLPELEAPTSAVADLILGQLFAGFLRRVFDPTLDLDEIERAAADTLVAALLPRT